MKMKLFQDFDFMPSRELSSQSPSSNALCRPHCASSLILEHSKLVLTVFLMFHKCILTLRA